VIYTPPTKRQHLLSFLRAPLGYVLNVAAILCVKLATVRGFGWVDPLFERTLLPACDVLCLRDGVQDEVWF
jgi:hypothetical protein